ncbi:hypothetical protein [Nostoc sp.]|uniref:hypothetical protein n=1 Tax=Nostoc sp. TaxID=1180 RepID=UPI002FF7A351
MKLPMGVVCELGSNAILLDDPKKVRSRIILLSKMNISVAVLAVLILKKRFNFEKDRL